MKVKFLSILVLLLTLNILLPWEKALAQAQLEVKAKIGIENKIKYGAGVPLSVKVTNNGDDFSGDIVIDAGVDYRIGSAQVYPFDIAAGETKTLDLYIDGYSDELIYANPKPEVIHFYEGGIEKGKSITYSGTKNFTPSRSDMTATFVYTLTENSDRLSAFQRLKQYSTFETHVFHLNQMKDYMFPSDSKQLQMANVIAVDEYSLTDLSAEQQQAMLDWVRQGGTLLIGASDQVEASAGIFSKYLPLTLKNERLTVSAETLKTLSVGGVFSKGIEVYQSTLNKEGIIELAEGDKILAASLKIGSGKVLQTTFSLGDEPLSSMDGYGKLLSEMLGITNQNTSNLNYYNGAHGVQQEWSMLNELFPSFEISIFWIVSLIVIYILVIGIALYFVLKRLDKREAAWWIIPLAAVAISVVLFIFGAKDRILHPQIQQMALFKVNEDGSLDGKYINTLLTNRGGDFVFEADQNTTVNALASVDFLGVQTENLHKQSYVKQKANGSTLTLKNLNYWSVQSFIGATTIEQAGKLDIDLSLENKKLKGTIQNNFPFALKDVSVVAGNRSYVLGDIEPNGQLKVSKDISTSTLAAVSMGSYNYSQPKTKADLMPQRIAYLDYSATYIMSEERMPMITAVTEEALVPVTFNGNAEMNTVTKLVQSFKPKLVMSGEVNFSENDMDISIVPSDGMGYAERINATANEWQIGEGAYDNVYALASGVNMEKMKWTQLQVKYDINIFTLEILNNKTKLYEDVPSSGYTITKNIASYVNTKGQVQFKMVRKPDTTGNSVKAPTITLTGEVIQ